MAMHESSMRRAAELVTVRVKNVNVLLRICRRAFLFVSAVAGIFLCTMSEPTDLPPSLTMLYFQDQVVPRLPTILDRNVNKLRYMFLRNITIPGAEGATAMSVYKNLTMLSLTNMSLTVVPLNVLDQVGLTQLEFSYNRLVSFPDQLLALQNLQTLSLEFNLISSIPSAFVRQFPSSLKTIYLDGNPLLALPLDTDFALIQSQRLQIRGTPMCDRLYAAARKYQVATLPPLEQQIVGILDDVCSPDCSVGCHARFVGNTVCESVCLVPSCNFDTKEDEFVASGTSGSDCFGLTTGWEPS
ncbi:hypothetical protein DYB30_012740 [Aphanomyces astaci]|uniref:LNR domain-containing protein n=1 Tax=Aphanomyces astaci TaxID=112090 RepID=A0A397CVD3_APHAT|nr:hypothetical protein DYB30_012740 [Aphanomyces astaci]